MYEMNFKALFSNIFSYTFVGLLLMVSPSISSTRFEENIVLNSVFRDDVFNIDMSYANETIHIVGHALTDQVKQCVTTMHSFAPHCVKKVQNKWPKADRKYQRIPEFYFDAIANRNFTYTLDFGAGSPLFEGFKCCIIYDIVDCIHTEYKSKCFGLSFAPIDEVLHLFAMNIEDKCDGFHADNKLYNSIYKSGERFHQKERKKDKNCKKRFLKNSDNFVPKTNICLIIITLLFSLRI